MEAGPQGRDPVGEAKGMKGWRGRIGSIVRRGCGGMARRLGAGPGANPSAPQTFTEKQRWLKLRGQGRQGLTDRAAARAYAEKVLGGAYLAPLMGVYGDPRQIPWEELPERIAARCTHQGGGEVIRVSRADFRPVEAAGRLRRWLRRGGARGGPAGGPRVMVEAYLGEADAPPLEYRVMCFNGTPQVIQAHQRAGGRPAVTFYGAGGRRLGMSWPGRRAVGPAQLEEGTLLRLLSAALALAQPLEAPYVRADFYWARGRLWFSRLAFAEDAGFRGIQPEAADAYLGSLLRLDALEGLAGTRKKGAGLPAPGPKENAGARMPGRTPQQPG